MSIPLTADGDMEDLPRTVRREKEARAREAALRDSIARTGMEEKFGEVLVPTEEVIEMRSGQKRRSERKFFPGYVLVQIATHDEAGIPRMDSESWHLVKETPKVMGFIGGTADRPLPIRDAEAYAILPRVQDCVE